VTVPQPSPDNAGAAVSAHNPWAPPEHRGRGNPHPEQNRPSRREELTHSVLALLLTAAAGALLLGLLWRWLAPRVPLITNGEALYPLNSESEEAIAADGTFLFLSLGLGLALGAAVFLLWRRGGVPLVIALALGAALGAVLAWRLGIWLEPTRGQVLERGLAMEPGGVLDAPLVLQAKVALLGLPFGAVAGHAICLGIWGPRDPEPPRPQPYPQWAQ
jgi:hypothetical protein